MFNLEKITDNFKNIPITRTSLEKIKAYARIARGSELYGFLLSPLDLNDGIVRKVILAQDQVVSGSSASLDPLAAANTKSEIETLGYKAIGFWHSHGRHNVFHSGIDDENMDNHYMTLALNNEEKIATPRKNSRYINFSDGKIVYEVNGLEFSITLENPQKTNELGFLSGDYIRLSEEIDIAACLTRDFRLLLKEENVLFNLGNIQKLEIKKLAEQNSQTLGVAYSIVVNDNGQQYGEMTANRWCSSCEKQERRTYKDTDIKIVEEGNEFYTEDELKRDISQRVKNYQRFMKLENQIVPAKIDNSNKPDGKSLCRRIIDTIANKE
jgi:hypothetical protein